MNFSTDKNVTNLSIVSMVSNFFVSVIQPFISCMKLLKSPFICLYLPSSTYFPAPNRNRGFSLIELVVTMIVAAVVAAIAIPNITGIIKSGRINTQINGLKVDLNYARSEAIKRRANVVVCQSPDGTSCNGTTGDWKEGRLIFVDTNKDGGKNVDEPTLRFREAVGGSDRSLQVKDNPGAAPVSQVTFTSNGGVTAATDFTICDGEGPTKGRRLSLSFTGLTTTLPAAPAACN